MWGGIEPISPTNAFERVASAFDAPNVLENFVPAVAFLLRIPPLKPFFTLLCVKAGIIYYYFYFFFTFIFFHNIIYINETKKITFIYNIAISSFI